MGDQPTEETQFVVDEVKNFAQNFLKSFLCNIFLGLERDQGGHRDNNRGE